MKASLANIQLSQAVIAAMRSAISMLNQYDIRIGKVSASLESITLQLEYSEQLAKRFPSAVLRNKNGRTYQEHFVEGVRLVWEVGSDAQAQ